MINYVLNVLMGLFAKEEILLLQIKAIGKIQKIKLTFMNAKKNKKNFAKEARMVSTSSVPVVIQDSYV